MTRHFLRDKNGEEMELYRFDSNPRYVGWFGIDVKGANFYAVDVWINQKLEFIVWQEV